ncbi:MAG TPA: SUMF1/EgtB/PvdO family nonheme iron enzyme [Planctomycetota bacterium]|nr:SUMF1/EgtB/PvdO family nonheme iron enzyme [Planctomycetota bacterium]
MGLSVELLKSCCASIAKMLTFSSIDPLLGTPTGKPMEFLMQHNFSVEEFRQHYRDALQKGSYMLEMALQESERMEENILIPFLEEYKDDKQRICERIISICQKLRTEEVLEHILNGLNSSKISQVVQDMGKSSKLYPLPVEFLEYLCKITKYPKTDLAFQFLIGKAYLFQAIDHQLRSSICSDSRLKKMVCISNSTKMKLRTQLVAKQIEDLNKKKSTLKDAKEISKINSQLALSQRAWTLMGQYLDNQKPVLDMLNNALSKLEQSIGHEVLDKTKSLSLLQTGALKETSELSGSVDVIEEMERLIQKSIEILGQDRIVFSHTLLGISLENQKAKIEKAKNIFEKIPNSHPQKAIFANHLGVISNAMGMPDKAAEYFRRALVLMPISNKQERTPIESNLFFALLNRGSFDAALKYMLESLAAGSEECNFFDVNRYVPKKILGVGGVGVTFLCEDVCEERMAVVKTLWQSSQGALKDLFAEAYQVQAIDDDKIVKIYEIGRHRVRHSFMVLEYYKGIDLEKYILTHRQGKVLNISEAVAIIRQVAQGLQVAHSQNPPILHRYIKPSNILLNEETGNIKIIDIGIANLMPEPKNMSHSILSPTESAITKNIANTWYYLSPEQQQGSNQITEKVDIFSLGKIFLFLLTGQIQATNATPFPNSKQAQILVQKFMQKAVHADAESRYSLHEFLENLEKLQQDIESLPPEIPTTTNIEKPSAKIASTIGEDEFFSIEKDNLKNLEEESMKNNNMWSQIPVDENSISPEPLFDSASWDVDDLNMEQNENAINTKEHLDYSSGIDLSINKNNMSTPIPSSGATISQNNVYSPSHGINISQGTNLSFNQGTDLSQSYNQNYDQGYDSSYNQAYDSSYNQAAYDSSINLSQGYDQNYNQGTDLSQGYDQNYNQGTDLSQGYDQNYNQGTNLSQGYDQNYNQGTDLSQGYDQGYDSSCDQGYDSSYDQGYDSSYDQGYDSSYDQGYDSSYNQGAELTAGSEDVVNGGAEFISEPGFDEFSTATNAESSGIHVAYGLDDLNDFTNPLDGQIKTGSTKESLMPTSPLTIITLPSGFSKDNHTIFCDKDGATMVYVPAGAFHMGYEGEGYEDFETPIHEVTLDGYLIDQYPVTWYQYEIFCKETGRKLPTYPCWEKDDSQPVVNVSWDDAMAYAYWAGKTLPSEAQWEKAAKGGFSFDGDALREQLNSAPDRKFPWGNQYPNQSQSDEWLANCAGEPMYGERSPSPVGTFKEGVSPYGCMDMAGNVWEWCLDWFSEVYYKTSPPANPKGAKSGPGRVLRGGAWNIEMEKLRVSYRTWMEPSSAWNVIGFRTVKQLMI